MTTIFPSVVECYNCGNSLSIKVIGSTNSMGYPDLDLRPPEMMRSTLVYQIQHCPSCGYCAKDISKGNEEVNLIISTETYKNLLTDESLPEKCRHFLCDAIILESQNKLSKAGWSALKAAWVCDDKHLNIKAKECRLKSIDYFEKAYKTGHILENPGEDESLLADLYRRTGQYNKAVLVCDEGLTKKPELIVQKILMFQKLLASKEDDYRHTIAEADMAF